MTVQEQLFTAADLLTLPNDRAPYALIKGKLMKLPLYGMTHGLLVSQINCLFDEFVDQHGLGQVYGTGTGFQTSENPDTVYGIDVAFVSKARIQKGEGYFLGAPDLAVEVISPGIMEQEIHEKITDYFNAGSRLVWVIYPKSRVIYIYGSPDQITVLHETDRLDGADVLPDFSVSIAELFSVLDE